MWPPARLQGLARRRSVRDLAVLFGSRWVQLGLGLLGSIISARALGPAEFGRFGIVISAVTIWGILADAGLTYATFRLVGKYSERQPERARAVALCFMLMRLAASTAVLLAGLALAAPLAAQVIRQPALTPYLQLALLILLTQAVGNYAGSMLVALGQFGRLAIANIANAAITAAGIAALWLLGRLNLDTLVAWNIALPIVSSLPAWFLLSAEWWPWRMARRRDTEQQRGVLREVFDFSKWIAVSNLGAMVSTQADVILMGRLAGPTAVGNYSVALSLATRLDTLNHSVVNVLTPRFSRLEGERDVRAYSRRVFVGSLQLVPVLVLVALVSQPLLPLLYGAGYEASAGLFLAMLVVVLFDLLTTPLFLAAFPLNKPRVLAVGDWLRAIVLVGVALALIPPWAGFGAIAARLAARVIGATYTLLTLRRAMGDQPGEDNAGLAVPPGAGGEGWAG